MYATSATLIARALVFCGSRGGFLATLFGTIVFVCLLTTSQSGRARLGRLAGACVLLAITLLALKPDLFQRPNLQRLLTATHPTEVDTLQWRAEVPWPYFWRKMLADPWLGIGDLADPNLNDSGNPPHNGYLAMAVTSGIPALLIVGAFAFMGLRDGFEVFARADDRWQRALGATIMSALVGVLFHNIVEATLQIPFVSKVFWMLVAVATMAARHPDFLPTHSAASATATRDIDARRLPPSPLVVRS